MNGLNGANVLVTGASRGIGLGVAKAFSEAGANVWTLAEDPKVMESAKSIGATGIIADVTDAPAISDALGLIGPLDVLVNNAGLERMTPVDATSPEATAMFRRILDVNVTGMAIVTSQALKTMEPGARIVNTASIWGRVAEPLFSAYVASKHAVIGLTKTWAMELGARGIRVNAVAPGWVRTEASAQIRADHRPKIRKIRTGIAVRNRRCAILARRDHGPPGYRRPLSVPGIGGLGQHHRANAWH